VLLLLELLHLLLLLLFDLLLVLLILLLLNPLLLLHLFLPKLLILLVLLLLELLDLLLVLLLELLVHVGIRPGRRRTVVVTMLVHLWLVGLRLTRVDGRRVVDGVIRGIRRIAAAGRPIRVVVERARLVELAAVNSIVCDRRSHSSGGWRHTNLSLSCGRVRLRGLNPARLCERKRLPVVLLNGGLASCERWWRCWRRGLGNDRS